MDTAAIRRSQKPRDMLPAFFPRKVSPWLTAWLLRTGATPHQVTVLWGVVSVATSGLVYLALTGRWWLVGLVFLSFVLAFTLDCCDGEIARFRGLSDPVGGKLLDGICHRATEYALLCVYCLAAARLTGHPSVLAVALVLLSGEAMLTFAYERRLSTLRVHLGYQGQIQRSAVTSYERGQRWRDLTPRQRVATVTGLIHYKSVYAMTALTWISGEALLGGLAVLAVWKHVSWLHLVWRTMKTIREHARAESLGERPALSRAR
jgi:phosphatidylglycerophosphate synthase